MAALSSNLQELIRAAKWDGTFDNWVRKYMETVEREVLSVLIIFVYLPKKSLPYQSGCCCSNLVVCTH
jgi:hypothetical protein